MFIKTFYTKLQKCSQILLFDYSYKQITLKELFKMGKLH